MRFSNTSIEFEQTEMDALCIESPVIAAQELCKGGMFDLWDRLDNAEQALKYNQQAAAKHDGSYTGWGIPVQGVIQSEIFKSARSLGTLLEIGTTVLVREIETDFGTPHYD